MTHEFKSRTTMDQRQSNHRNGGRSQHLHNGGLDRGRQRDNHAGGGRNGWKGGRDSEREGEGNYDRHDNFQGSQEQYQQQQQQQGERGSHARKRSHSPSNTHHNDPHQQKRQSDTPNNNYPHKSPHHDNHNITSYKEREDSVLVGCPPDNAPQQLLRPPPPFSKQPQSPPVGAAAVLAPPPEKRRTLILSNIPSHIQFYHLRNFFQTNWNAPVQYCVLDRQVSEAYVVFKSVQDAQRVWMEGRKHGLDGNGTFSGGDVVVAANSGKSLENTDDFVSSLIELGVELRAVHFSNHINLLDSETITPRGGGDNHNNQGEYKQHVHNNYARPEPSHVSPASACIQTTNTTINNNNTFYHPRTPIPSINQQCTIQPSVIELQLQQQEEAEKWARWEAFQLEEMEWRKRRHVEYNTFIQAKNGRSTQLSTLEQKRDLLSKQEHMLSQQLPLHKKMLVMLKSKNATPSEQSTKMKEILSTSKRIVELKMEMKGVMRDIEKMKEEESVVGVFRPSEKRPVFSGNVGGPNARVGSGKKRSLDRRTTALKVQGFDEADNANEETIMKQFSIYGTITSARLEKRSVDSTTGCGGNDEASTLVAFINYENRIDAERAKSEISNLDGSLTCTWHNPSASAGSTAKSDGQNPDGKDHELETDGFDDDHGLFDDYDDGEDNGEQFSNNENAGGDYDGEEDFVDYD